MPESSNGPSGLEGDPSAACLSLELEVDAREEGRASSPGSGALLLRRRSFADQTPGWSLASEGGILKKPRWWLLWPRKEVCVEREQLPGDLILLFWVGEWQQHQEAKNGIL